MHSALFHHSPLFGKALYGFLKGWKGIKSGPDVHLGFLNFLAVTMASSIAQAAKGYEDLAMTDPAIPPKVDDGFSPTTISPLLKGLNWDLNDAKIQTRLFDELLKLGISDPYNFLVLSESIDLTLHINTVLIAGTFKTRKQKALKPIGVSKVTAIPRQKGYPFIL